MAKKLFAMEDMGTEGTEVELEAAPEVGEVADAQVEVEQELAEVSSDSDGISEGVAAADQLEQVEDVVDAAANGEGEGEGEGLTPVAAEAIRIAVESICARVGASPKAMYSLYATENFKSASSRKANTKFALEGIGEFLKDLWARIKAAVNGLIEKVIAFWNKHVSSLGRSLKALESMKEKVSQLKGRPTNEIVEVPSSLQSVFPVKATLGVDEIAGFQDRLTAAKTSVKNFDLYKKIGESTKLTDITGAFTHAKAGATMAFGAEDAPMPGGKYFKWTFKVEENKVAEGVNELTLDVDENHGEYTDGNKKAQLDIASKEELKNLITATITSTKEIIKYRDDVVKRNKQITANQKNVDKDIENAVTAAATNDKKNVKIENKNALRAYSLVLSKAPVLESKLLSTQLTYIKGVLTFASLCAKNYTKD